MSGNVPQDDGLHWHSRWVSDWPSIIRNAWRTLKRYTPRVRMLSTATSRGVVIAWPRVDWKAAAWTLGRVAYTVGWILLTTWAIHHADAIARLF